MGRSTTVRRRLGAPQALWCLFPCRRHRRSATPTRLSRWGCATRPGVARVSTGARQSRACATADSDGHRTVTPPPAPLGPSCMQWRAARTHAQPSGRAAGGTPAELSVADRSARRFADICLCDSLIVTLVRTATTDTPQCRRRSRAGHSPVAVHVSALDADTGRSRSRADRHCAQQRGGTQARAAGSSRPRRSRVWRQRSSGWPCASIKVRW